MTSTSAIVGGDAKATSKTNRYRLPGIEREGIAQLSLLETALWPLSGKRNSSVFGTSYSFVAPTGKKTAEVTVRSAIGLQPIDELVLWGLLGATLSRPNADPVLLATPYWILRFRRRSFEGGRIRPNLFSKW